MIWTAYFKHDKLRKVCSFEVDEELNNTTELLVSATKSAIEEVKAQFNIDQTVLLVVK